MVVCILWNYTEITMVVCILWNYTETSILVCILAHFDPFIIICFSEDAKIYTES